MSVKAYIVVKIIKPLIIKVLVKFTGYFNGELYQFSYVNGELELIEANKSFKPKLLIAASCYCQEKQLCLPVENLQELKKLLKLQLTEQEYCLIQHQENNQSYVNVWSFNPLLYKVIPHAWLILPETLLLSRGCSNGEVIVVTNEKQQKNYISVFNGLIYSIQHSSIINTVDKFAMSIGIVIKNQKTLTVAAKIETFATSFMHSSVFRFSSFLRKPSSKSITKYLTQFFLPSVLIMALYLASTSGYLWVSNISANKILVKQSKEVSELLKQQTTLEKKYETYQQLTTFWQSKQNIASLWSVVAPIFKISTIRTINLTQGRFFIRGRTPDASDLLDSIVKNPNVKNARFESPVRKERNQDSFYLSLKLNNEFQLNSKGKGSL